MNCSALKIGDLVTLKSHAYLNDLTSVLITGDHSALPPIMIVKEIRQIKNEAVSSEQNFLIKCIWFSSKSNALQENTFKGIHLRHLETKEKLDQTEVISEGDLVLLKSTELELKKRKSTFSVEESSNAIADKNTQSALLNYLPPILHVISIKEFKVKDTADTDKTFFLQPKKKVKCFYYNAHSDRISEIELPSESLSIVEPLEENLLMDLNSYISDKSYVLCRDEHDKMLVLQPKTISFRSGFYFLRAYEIISGRNIEINISNDIVYKRIESIVAAVSPVAEMSYLAKEKITDDLIEKIKLAKSEKLYLRLKYKNKNDEISSRTVSNFFFQKKPEEDSVPRYLTGYCHLREEERTFNIKRIQFLEVLSVNFE
ncbi:hypothetical protein OC25_25715 [Pedobacter kyungheensis]|uniref:WYL domain-containing protein n=1 Tax=Pedobacter kyungheensis TaxID=1069985 RepID=A0A0C1F6V8_9SPHI|nr:hypothetical protein [Pedobacter kyungheensis]KIA88932.1 hypothetical protein OC25_25715 [Pedobacter kyungheensis]